jgi:PAS domain S-box-containing protein
MATKQPDNKPEKGVVRDTKPGTKQQVMIKMLELQTALDSMERRLEEANDLLQARGAEAERCAAASDVIDDLCADIIETVRMPLVVLSHELRVIKVNLAFYKTFIAAPEETEGQYIFNILNRSMDIPGLRMRLSEMLPQNSRINDFRVECEFPVIGRRTMLLNARRICSPERRRDMILLDIWDITEPLKAEEALREETGKYRELVANANSIIIKMEQNGRITFFNEYAQKFFGYAQDEILGEDIKILAPKIESDGKNLEEMMDRVLSSPDDFCEEIHENIRKSGERVWISWRNKAIRDADGNVVGNLALGRDITIQREAVEALEASEIRYRRLFEAAKDGILILDAATGQILNMNPFISELLGYTSEDMLGKTLWDSGIFIDPEVGREAFGELREKGYLHFEDLALVKKDGSSITAEFVGNVYTVDEQKVVRCNVRDITERKLLSDALQKVNNELEQRVERRTAELQSALAEIQKMKDQLEAENIYFRQETKMRYQFDNILGQSDGLKYVLYRVEQVAPTDTTVLILGETGTGKELIANAIHNMSPRKGRSLITVNCAALPANLIESELFGRERGAFTGADTTQVGRFEIANGSTIFLDEIGELPLEMQSKLLRVIQHNEFERLGSSRTIRVDVRIVAATNRNLEDEVKSGRFRQDLYYRLNVFPITVPPLRQRTDDIPLLVQAFVDRYARKLGKKITSIHKDTMRALLAYPWPGNVRELESRIERAVILCRGEVLQLGDELDTSSTGVSIHADSLEDTERVQILKILSETKWRIEGKDGAALILGLKPSTLRARMHKLGITRPEPS